MGWARRRGGEGTAASGAGGGGRRDDERPSHPLGCPRGAECDRSRLTARPIQVNNRRARKSKGGLVGEGACALQFERSTTRHPQATRIGCNGHKSMRPWTRNAVAIRKKKKKKIGDRPWLYFSSLTGLFVGYTRGTPRPACSHLINGQTMFWPNTSPIGRRWPGQPPDRTHRHLNNFQWAAAAAGPRRWASIGPSKRQQHQTFGVTDEQRLLRRRVGPASRRVAGGSSLLLRSFAPSSSARHKRADPLYDRVDVHR